MFGKYWRFSYESAIQLLPDRVLVWKGSGQRLGYGIATPPPGHDPNTPLTGVSLDGSRDRLLYYGAYFMLIESGSRLQYRYDRFSNAAWARLTSIADQNGNSVRLAYDNENRLTSITDASGRSTNFAYDASHRCIGFSLPDGNRAQFAYDGQGNLIKAIDLIGTTILYEYDGRSYLTRMVVGRDQKATTFTYQESRQGRYLGGVTDAAGNTTSYELVSITPRHVRMTDPEGNITSYYSTPQGYTERVVDPLGNSAEASFANGLPVRFTNARKQSTQLEYDPRGNIIRRKNSLGSVWASAYDQNNRLISETDPLGATWQYGYDERGNLVRSTSPDQRTLTREYDSKGQMVSLINTRGEKTLYAYDRFGNLVTITRPRGDTVQHGYDPHGFHRIATTDANGFTTKYEFDANRRLTRQIHPDGSSRVSEYDCCAGTAVTDENGNKRITRRDPVLQILEKTDPQGNSSLFVYDRNKRQVKTEDALGRAWGIVYDPAGRIVEWNNANNEKGRMEYDPEGNLIAIWDELGNKTSFVYDANNRPVESTDPLGHTQRANYDSSGRLISTTNARGNVVQIKYDQLGRIVERSVDNNRVAAYAYDDLGNLVQMTDAWGVTNFAFDAGRKAASIRFPDQTAIAASYDPNGNLASLTYPGGQTVNYVYDVRNRVARMEWGRQFISFRYDAVGNLVEVSRSNATQTTCAYDAANRLTRLVHRAKSEPFADLSYTYDPVGNITAESGTLPLQARPLEAPSPMAYNSLNQIVRLGDEPCTYDPDGNLTGMGSGRWQAKYDPQNRMTEIVRDGQVRRYSHNANGQRVQVDTQAGRRVYHYDLSGRLLFETDQTSALVAFYLYRNAHLVARVDASGAVLFYHFDKTGNTLALSDHTGDVVAAYAYDPYGAITNKLGEVDNPFTYVGEFGVMDDGNGVYWMRYRIYDAHTGRFVQKDPLGFVEGTNLYAYVSNNPIKNIDPFGLAWYWPPSWFEPGTQAAIETGTGLAADLTGGAILTGAVGGTITVAGVTLSAPVVGTVVLLGGLALTVKGIMTWNSSAQAQKAQQIQTDANKKWLAQGPDGKWKIDPLFEDTFNEANRQKLQDLADQLNNQPECKP